MILAFTGAGISQASGVPTFAKQPGIRDCLTRSYAIQHPAEYGEVIAEMQKACNAAAPNDAHLALAEYDVPVITMNVDGLHQKARSRHILAIHGTLPDIVLYDDPAPLYEVAHNWVFQLPGRGLLPDSRNLLLYQHLRAAQAGGAQKGSGCVRNRPRCGASGPRFPSEGGYSGLHFRAILGKKSIHIRTTCVP